VFELFNAGTQGFPGFTDPCANFSPTGAPLVVAPATAAACATQFAAAGTFYPAGVFQQNNAQFQVVGFGNNSLTPEKSNTFTAGVVLAPSFLPGVTASVDYYHIAINNFIGAAYGGSNSAVAGCIAAIQAGTPIPAFIGVGNPSNPAHTNATPTNICQYITRLPNGDPITALPNTNTGGGNVKTGGFDIQLSVQHDVADLFDSTDDLGALDFNFATSILTQFYDPQGGCGGAGNPGGVPGDPGACSFKGHADYFGTAVFATVNIRPNIRWSARLGYTLDDWRFLLSWNHIGKVSDSLGTGQDLPEYDTFDLAIRWNFSENYSADVVLNNLFDKGPPLGAYGAIGGINTIAEAYDVLGVRGSIGLTARL
jgi:outer membrane receptor protein involved in Fe transport